MQDNVKYEQTLAHAGWLDCFRPGRKTLYRTLLGMSLQSLQVCSDVVRNWVDSDFCAAIDWSQLFLLLRKCSLVDAELATDVVALL